MPRVTLAEVADLARAALESSSTSADNARTVAASIAAAEADGIPSHGVLRLPIYCAHARSGKVDGRAVPVAEQVAPAALRVDARNGFAHPAIGVGLEALFPLARREGIAILTVHHSYNAGVMGHHVEALANGGLVAMAFANAPAVLAPWGGSSAAFGTNPLAFASPRGGDHPPIVIDLASTVVARGEIILRARRGERVPLGWGLDARGEPTDDPSAILAGGTLAPAGGHKGAALALMVEIVAAAVTGARFSRAAGSLTEVDHEHAGIGQCLIAIDPEPLAGPGFRQRIEALCEALLADPGVRLPGMRRAENRLSAARHGVDVDAELLDAIAMLAGSAPDR